MLHIVSKKQMINRLPIESNDVLVLLADGVYLAEELHEGYPDITIYLLTDDMVARGLINQVLPQIDYAAFVDLTTQHHPIITW